MNYKTTIPVLAILLISVTIPTTLAEEGDLTTNVLELQNKIYNFQLELANAKLLATSQVKTIMGLSEKLEIRTNQVGIQNERIQYLETQNAKYSDDVDELRAQIINSTQATVSKDFWEDYNKKDLTVHKQSITIEKLNEKIERLTTDTHEDDLKVRHDKMYDDVYHYFNLVRVLDVCHILNGTSIGTVDHVELRKELWSGKHDLNSCLP